MYERDVQQYHTARIVLLRTDGHMACSRKHTEGYSVTDALLLTNPLAFRARWSRKLRNLVYPVVQLVIEGSVHLTGSSGRVGLRHLSSLFRNRSAIDKSVCLPMIEKIQSSCELQLEWQHDQPDLHVDAPMLVLSSIV